MQLPNTDFYNAGFYAFSLTDNFIFEHQTLSQPLKGRLFFVTRFYAFSLAELILGHHVAKGSPFVRDWFLCFFVG